MTEELRQYHQQIVLYATCYCLQQNCRPSLDDIVHAVVGDGYFNPRPTRETIENACRELVENGTIKLDDGKYTLADEKRRYSAPRPLETA